MMTEANDTYRYDAFIGYSHHDKDWVDSWLLPRLEAAGLCVCIDYRDFEPGLPSLVNMENAVERSRKTLIVLTPAWVESEWTTFESLLVQTDDPAGRRARIIPLRLEPCKPPKRIAMLTYLDFTQPTEAQFQLQRLVTAIRSEPMRDADRPSPDRIETPSEDHVQISGAQGTAIGDRAQVAGHPAAPPTGQAAPGISSAEERALLEQELAQHRRNLLRLRQQKAIYAEGEVPLRLLNQIEAEEREIQRIEKALRASGGGN